MSGREWQESIPTEQGAPGQALGLPLDARPQEASRLTPPSPLPCLPRQGGVQMGKPTQGHRNPQMLPGKQR